MKRYALSRRAANVTATTAFRSRDSACISRNGVSSQRGSEGRRDRDRARTDCTPSIPRRFHMPAPRKPDQSAPRSASPTGVTNGQNPDPDPRAQSGEFLTTAQGLRLPDTDHSLKAGARGPDAAGGLSPAREDHSLRPRAHPGAGGARPRRRRARRVRVLRQRGVGDQGRVPRQEGHENRRLHPILDRARLPRIGRHGPRHPRVRGEVLHRRRHLRPGRQQHAGVLHPGRHQVPRHHPRRQAAARPRDPAGAVRPRHVLGLRIAAHRSDAPRDLEHE